MVSQFRHKLQKKFIAGIVIVLPIGVTVVLLGMMFTWLDGLFAPWARRLTDRTIPGLGIISTLLFIFAVGIIVRSIIGRALVSFGERLVAKIPFIRDVYSGAKQVLETLTMRPQTTFTQAVMIEYPKKGSYAIGFITGDTTREIEKKLAGEYLNVFVPTTPNPTTGFLVLVPQEEITGLPITIEEGIKMVVSGGIIQPVARSNAAIVKDIMEKPSSAS